MMVASFTVQHEQHYGDKDQERDLNSKEGKQTEINVSYLDEIVCKASGETRALESNNPLNKHKETLAIKEQESHLGDKTGEQIETDIPDVNQIIAQPSTTTVLLEMDCVPKQLLPNLSLEGQQTGVGITKEQLIEMIPSRMVFLPVLPSSLTENQTADLKNALKVASLVVAISATGILGAFTGFSGNRTDVSKLMFKAWMLSMCISFLSSLILLALLMIRPNFKYLILVAKGIMWAALGMVTVAVVLVLVFYIRKT
ncbi:hypothetical protein NE237_032983 [Protea cynaroides]|uniref:Uncharacterized protein n=1 Tax=Protea cynaroides TaxID=273540 RepID=A0A9Q0L5U3_9MAGN|nr:hypothetical protein NE237_032983 [Protea cynaroides]